MLQTLILILFITFFREEGYKKTEEMYKYVSIMATQAWAWSIRIKVLNSRIYLCSKDINTNSYRTKNQSNFIKDLCF